MKKLNISTTFELEVNEICELFLFNNRNCIRIIQILNCLRFKDPVTYNKFNYFQVKKAVVKLFTTHYKISDNQIKINKSNCELKIKPISELKLSIYGLEKYPF